MRIVPKNVAVVLAAAILASTSACGSADTGDAGSGGSAGGSKKITLLVASLTTTFFVAVNDEAKRYAKEKNVDLRVLTSDNDPAKELSNMQDIVGQKPDLILFDPVDSAAAAASVAQANNAKIPVVTFDRGVEGGTVVSHIASDNVAGGKMAAEFLKGKFPDGANVVELQGILATDIAKQRGQGFEDELKTAPNLKLVASQTANFDKSQGFTVFQNLLQANPGVNAVFAQNDEMALGALQAAIAAKRTDIAIVGFDASPEAVKAVEAGTMAATVAQLPDKIIQTAMDASLAYLAGEKVEPQIAVGLELVKK